MDDGLGEVRAEINLVRSGYRLNEINEWSLPKFRLRSLLVDEARIQDALLQSLAVWDGEKADQLINEVKAAIVE